MRLRTCLAALIAAVLATGALVGCDDDDGGSGRAQEGADQPARTPPGWRTVTGRGFTIAVPRGWTARTGRRPALIRSSDRLLVAAVAVDRSDQGRSTAAAEYVRQVVDGLPGFEGSIDPEARRVAGSPYPSARVDAGGRVDTSPGVQLITAAAFQRPGVATYSVVVFRNARVAPRRHNRALRQMLASLRLDAH